MLKIQNNNKNKNIQRKISSLTLMAIMVAGGMTFAVPGMVPEAYAANANLFVSAENSLFDNYMSGPQVIEVAIIDSSISDTNEGKGEPDVTVNGNQLRMVQATDGNWYGYFADYEMARAADNDHDNGDRGLDFGEFSPDGTAVFTESFEADGLFYDDKATVTADSNVNVVREPKNLNEYPMKKYGQINLESDIKWPFIQLYTLSAGGNVVVQYNKGGGAQSTTLTFDTVDDYAGIMLDRTSYPQGAQVHATITDAWLNIDPTDEDSWTFNTDNGDAFYHIYNDNGGNGESTFVQSVDAATKVSSVNVGDLMCSDCALKLNPNVQGDDKHVITIQRNADSIIVNKNATAPASTADAWLFDSSDDEVVHAIIQLGEGTQPVTITEQGPNSGIFGTYDESDDSLLRILDDAERGTSATIDYNDTPVSVLVTHAFAEIDIQPASAVWNSGELIPVVLVDADVNKNSRADEDISLSDPSYKIIPSLRTGSPITLGSGADSDGNIKVAIGENVTVAKAANGTTVSVDAFSDRAILNITDKNVKALLIDLDITGEQLKSSLVDTTDDKNYGYNLFNYDIQSLVEGEDDSLGEVQISLVNTNNGVEINVPLVCPTSERQGLGLLPTDCKVLPDPEPTSTPPADTTPEPIVIPLLYKSGDAYEMQHFGTAFDEAVSDFNATQTSKAFSSQKLPLGTTAIQSVLDTGAQGAVGTYTSQQLKDLNDTGKVGTDVGDIVLLSYSSAATSFAEPGDGIFRLTTDTSRQVESVITQLIPANFDNIISIHLDDAWSQDYVKALAATYDASHRTIAYDKDANDIAAEFNTVLNVTSSTKLSNLDAQTAIVILEYNHERLDALIEELAKKKADDSYAYAGIETTKFIIPDVPSGAFGATLSANANALLKDTDMKTIKFALSDNTAGQTALTTAILNQSPNDEVNPDGNELFDRHAYSAYDAGQILTRAIDALPTGYTTAQLNAAIPTAAAAYSSDALIYNTVLNADGDLACMVYDIFEINDSTGGFTLQEPMQATTDATNCPIIGDPVPTPNADPVISSVDGARVVVVNDSLTLTVVAADADTSDSLTYSANNTAAVSANNDNVFVFTAPTTEGTVAIEFTVTDGNGGTVTQVVTIAVHPVPVVNVAPEFTATSVMTTATVGERLTFMVEGTDDNPGDTPESLTFEMTQPQGQTATATLTATGNFTWTPVTADEGRNTFTFVAIDDENTRSDPVSIVITVDAAPVDPNVPNVAPVIDTSNAVRQATVDQAVTFTVGVTDANPADTRNTISLTATAQGVTTQPTVDRSTGVFTWTPVTADIGAKVFTFTATDDGGASSNVQVTITVSAATNGQTPVDPNVPNVAPVITPITSPPAATEGQELTFTIVATDANPADTTFTFSAAYSGLASTPDFNRNTGVLTWTPVAADIGDRVFTFTAFDDERTPSTQVSVTITVSAAPQANNVPVFESIIPQSTTVGTAVSFTVEATDADTNDDLDYDLVGQIGAFNGNTRIFTWTPTTAGTENIVFTVDDGNGGSDRLTVQITVYPARVAFDSTIFIPMLYLDVAGNYEQQFADAVTNAVNDYDFGDDSISSTQNYYDQRYNITTGTTADIDTIVNAGHKGTVGTYSSEQLEQYKDESRIVFLSYASTASTLTVDTDNIFRLTVDNKRQTADVLKPLLDEDDIVNVITIHRDDAWSADFKDQLVTLYGNNHKEIAYNSSATDLTGEIMSKLTTANVGTIAANTAIVILGFGEVETVIMELSNTHTNGTYIHTGIDTTKIFIPDLAATVPSTLDAEGLALLKATDMKTIKFALSDDAQAYHDTANSGNEYSDRHVYAAYDAAQILARSIDQLGKEYTAEQLKTKIPEVARAYSDDALIYRTVLDANGDLECMVYDVLEIADDATAADFTYKDADPKTTDATNCPISAGTSSSSTILSNPQTVSCIDCAINSFGEIFGQTVQVHQTTTAHNHTEPITNILDIHDDSKLAILIEYQNPVTTDSEDDPIVLDFFAFGFGDDGRTANQIVRLELEETGDNTNTFTGGLEYTMLNQLNILDADTYTGLSPISDEPTFIVMEDLTDEDSPRVNYLDLGADGVSTQIADQQAAPSHNGKVALDSESYKVADTVIITLTDADLNVDSDLIDIFTTVEPYTLTEIENGKNVTKSGKMSDTVGDRITFNGKSVEIDDAPLGRLLDVTFNDEKWTVNSCGMNDIDNGLQETGFTLIETGTASGVFTGSFQIPSEYCPEGETERESVTGTDIEVNYLDYRDASGEIIEVGDSAGVRASTGSIALDRTVYPVPFGESTFNLHASAGDGEYLPQGDVSIHVRVSDPDYDVSASGEDVIAHNNVTNMNVDGTADKVGPVIVTVSRGSDSVVVATAGGTDVIEANTIGNNAKEYGPITEIAPDAGIFEADITISSIDGPNTNECPDSDGCVLQGDIITVQYNDPTDASGEPNTITDSATFDLRNAVLQSDKSVYIIGSDMILTLIEPDFDLDSDGAETYSLDLIEWDSDADTTSMGPLGGDNAAAFDPEPNAFRETGDSTGIFQVVVEIPESLGDDKLERGEEIELEYTDLGPSGSDYVGEEEEDINLTIFTSNFGSTIELDQKVYTWTDKVYITIVAPDHNFDSDLIDEIGDSEEDPIRIATRDKDLDNYKLVETGTDTGIFTGEVILTGFVHDANGDGKTDDTNPRTGDGVDPKNIKGLGPTNGFLEAEDDDGLSVSFEFSEDETVIASSLIRWNIGEAQWLEASYAASGTGLVRIVDPDMNLNPESVDNFEIDIWSDTHAGGIDLTVTETNQATGIFEGTVFFTVTDESSGHRLRVSEGDTVTAEYEDRTLPDPHDTRDTIDITATTQIGSIIPPLERAPATNLRVVDAFSNTLDTLDVDQQVQITADLANGQDNDQPFAYIVQIQDSSSVTVALAWVSGTLTPSQSFSPALSWTPSEAGTYTATAFVWESVDNPTALSPPNELTITVN